MAQYNTWTEDGTVYFRRGARDGWTVVDQTKTPLGFNGDKGVDWDMVRRDKLPS